MRQVIPHEHEKLGKLRSQIFANNHSDRLATHVATCAYNVSEMGRTIRVVVRLLLNSPGFIGATFLVQRRQSSEQLETFRRIYVHPGGADQSASRKFAGGLNADRAVLQRGARESTATGRGPGPSAMWIELSVPLLPDHLYALKKGYGIAAISRYVVAARS